MSIGEAVKMSEATASSQYVKAVATAKDMMRGLLSTNPSYAVDMSSCTQEEEVKFGGRAYEHVLSNVFPFVEKKADVATTAHYRKWLETWWRPRTPRDEFFSKLGDESRLVVCSRHAARPIFAFLDRRFALTDSLQLFAFDDDYSFGILQSNHHWSWTVIKGTKIKEDTRYTSEVWRTFPWPQEPTPEQIENVARCGRELRQTRQSLMDTNRWSLRELYQAAEIDGPHRLKSAQVALDNAVAAAYGIPADQEITEFLLDLNLCLAEDERDGHAVQGPGLPAGLDPKDPRWYSTDCIKPPPLE